jgi:mandelate racemase
MTLPPLTVRGLRARPVLVPFRRPPVAATGALPTAPLVLVDLETAEGVTGRAYVFAYTAPALEPVVGCFRALLPLIEGQPLAPLDLEARLRGRLTLLGTPGLVGLALAGVDMAAWDALARAAGAPLATFLGGRPRPIPAYNSSGLWLGPLERLADEAAALVAEGFSAVKLRVGRPVPADDLAAVRAVRARLGDAATVMADYNQKLTVNEAILRGRALDGEGLAWIEEPVRHDDYAGCARVAREVRTPIQIGENLSDTFQLVQALAAGASDYLMPDVQRVGGVTGWLRAAAIAHAHGVEVSSHLFPEFSRHLLAVTPTCHWLEWVDWAAPVLREPAEVRHGHVPVPERPGAGLEWDEAAVARFLAG